MDMAGKMSEIDMQGASGQKDARNLRNATGAECSAWVRRLAASLFVFAALGTALPAAAQTEVWTATFTPGDLGFGILGCSNSTTIMCSNTSHLSDDSFIRSVATSADAVLDHNGTFVMGGAGRNPEGPSARFSDLPANHDGTTAFTVELHFSAEPDGLSYRTVQGGLLEVEGAAVTRAARITRGSNMGWRVTVAPSGDGEIEIGLPARECGKPNVVCIGGRPLERAAQATIPGTAPAEPPPPPPVPLTASFSGAPAEHTGSGSFELQFRLSEEPAGLSYRTVHNGLFDVTGASIGRAWRLQRGDNTGWGLRVEPSGFGDVTLVVRATTDCGVAPGVCTSNGRMLGGEPPGEDCRAAHAVGGRCRGRRELGRHARRGRGHPHASA